MRFVRERVFLIGLAVLAIAAALSVRQFATNRTRHAELREAFIVAHQRGLAAEAETLYRRLKFAMPSEPTGHLIDDLARTTPIAPAGESSITNMLVLYHLSVKHEVERRLAQKFQPTARQ